MKPIDIISYVRSKTGRIINNPKIDKWRKEELCFPEQDGKKWIYSEKDRDRILDINCLKILDAKQIEIKEYIKGNTQVRANFKRRLDEFIQNAIPTMKERLK